MLETLTETLEPPDPPPDPLEVSPAYPSFLEGPRTPLDVLNASDPNSTFSFAHNDDFHLPSPISSPAFSCHPLPPIPEEALDRGGWPLVFYRLAAPFMDFRSLCVCRGVNKTLKAAKWNVVSLRLSQCTTCTEPFYIFKILPIIRDRLHISSVSLLDFSNCVQMPDEFVIKLFQPRKHHPTAHWASLCTIYFDRCPLISDKTLVTLLSTSLPSLERISFRSIRSRDLSYQPFEKLLCKTRWPRFHQFCASFTFICTRVANVIAKYVTSHEDPALSPKFSVCGSLATNSLFRQLDLSPFHSDFLAAMKSKSVEEVEAAANTFFAAWKRVCDREAAKDPNTRLHLPCLLSDRGMQLLVSAPCAMDASQNIPDDQNIPDGSSESNCPQTCNTKEEEALEATNINTFVNHKCRLWTYPLQIAIRAQREDIAALLTRLGCQVEIGFDFTLPMCLAMSVVCENKEFDFEAPSLRILRMLIKAGAAVNPIDYRTDRWPLFPALLANRPDLTRLLVAAGAYVNVESFNGIAIHHGGTAISPLTPLYVAAKHKSLECVEVLLELGAHPHSCVLDNGTVTSPLLAIYNNLPSLLQKALACGDWSRAEARSIIREVLSATISKRDIPNVSFIVSAFPDLVAIEHSMWSYPIVQAAILDDPVLLGVLTRAGADVNSLGADGTTALHRAAQEGNSRAIGCLCEAGADPNLSDRSGMTALHIAALEKQADAIRALLHANADPNIRDNTWLTPLMVALSHRHTEAALALVSTASLDTEATDLRGRTALVLAAFYCQFGVAEALLDRQNKMGGPADPKPFECLLKKKLETFATSSKRRFLPKVRHMIFWSPPREEEEIESDFSDDSFRMHCAQQREYCKKLLRKIKKDEHNRLPKRRQASENRRQASETTAATREMSEESNSHSRCLGRRRWVKF